MALDNISKIADILANVTTILAIVAAGWVAYGIFLSSSSPDVSVEKISFFSKDFILDEDDDYPFVFSLQFRFFNPAVGSRVVIEIDIGEATMKNQQSEAVWLPGGFIPIANLAKFTKDELRVEAMYHPILLRADGLETRHVVFIPKTGRLPDEFSGQVVVEVNIPYKVYNPATRVIRKPRLTPQKLHIEFNLETPIDKSKLRMIQSYSLSQRVSKAKRE